MSALTSERVQYLIRYFSEDAWATHPAALDTIAALRELLEARKQLAEYRRQKGPLEGGW